MKVHIRITQRKRLRCVVYYIQWYQYPYEKS